MKHLISFCCGLLVATGSLLHASSIDAAMQAKVDEQVKIAQAIAADPVIVAAVKAQNQALPPDLAAMTQDKWKASTVLDPVVKGLSKNTAAEVIRAKKDVVISEAFLSDAAGCKVAFLSKTTGWCHKGKPKHDVPMQGKVWQGDIEVDASSGVQSIQVAVPVLDGGTPIGSLVVGLSVSKLK